MNESIDWIARIFSRLVSASSAFYTNNCLLSSTKWLVSLSQIGNKTIQQNDSIMIETLIHKLIWWSGNIKNRGQNWSCVSCGRGYWTKNKSGVKILFLWNPVKKSNWSRWNSGSRKVSGRIVQYSRWKTIHTSTSPQHWPPYIFLSDGNGNNFVPEATILFFTGNKRNDRCEGLSNSHLWPQYPATAAIIKF